MWTAGSGGPDEYRLLGASICRINPMHSARRAWARADSSRLHLRRDVLAASSRLAAEERKSGAEAWISRRREALRAMRESIALRGMLLLTPRTSPSSSPGGSVGLRLARVRSAFFPGKVWAADGSNIAQL